MKKAISLIILVWGFQATAQLVTLVDKNTGDAISLAHVSIEGTSHGIISNYDGEVNLSVFSETEEITISHIAYEKLQFRRSDVQNNQIALEPLDIVLSEIVVSDVSAFQILQRAIAKQKGQIPKEATHTGYYREYVSTNNEYTKYADGQLLYKAIFNKDKYKVTPSVIQSRVYSPEIEEEIDVDVISFIDIKTLIEYNVVSSIGRFLKTENQEDYVYEFGASPNPDYYLIDVEPIQGIEKTLYSAKVLINRETFLIHELTFQTHPEYIGFSKEYSLLGIHIRILEFNGQLRFEELNNLSYLKYGKISMELSIKSKNIDQVNVFTSELLVYDFEEKVGIKMKSYNKRSLYKSKGKYHENFWESGNSIPLSNKEKKVIEEVTKNLK